MKERPILFSGPMVRALLDGRKAQTRRLLTEVQKLHGYDFVHILSGETARVLTIKEPPGAAYAGFRHQDADQESSPLYFKCPYGQPGDRLWVREKHARYGAKETWCSPHYFADSETLPSINERHDAGLLRTYPSIHMPRWASRITLEITRVRVERLRDISEEDARAEGARPSIVGDDLDHLKFRAGFQTLWDSINGKPRKDSPDISWEANPWVWVVEFKLV